MPSHLHCSNVILLLTCVNPNGAYIVFNENPADDSITNGVPFSCSGLHVSYGTISCTSSFLMGFTRSSRFTPRYMAIAAATNTDEYTPRRMPIVSANAK